MSAMDFPRRIEWVLCLVVGFGCASGAADAERPSVEVQPRATMRSIVEEMKHLVPLSLDEVAWRDPMARTSILERLERLDGAVSVLERHGIDREAGFDELALTLGRDLRAARDHYAHGLYEEARFFIAGGVQSCVSCHTRLPAADRSPLADELTANARVESLPRHERAWLFVMVRRFEDALALWELEMADPTQTAVRLDASGVLVDFLNVAIRVRDDVGRARVAIDRFAARDDLPLYLRRRIDTWRSALETLESRAPLEEGESDVDAGESLAREAGQLAAGPYGRDGLVQDLAAASHLVRFLEVDRARRRTLKRNPTSAERNETARAYYWLAIVEERSLDGFWINLADRHYEASIRADPRGAYATRAYVRLEEANVIGFGGASGQELPADVWTHLKELRELMGLEERSMVPENGPVY